MHDWSHNLVILRRNNLVIVKLFGKLVLIMFFGYQGYRFFLQAKRKCATKTFTIYNSLSMSVQYCRNSLSLDMHRGMRAGSFSSCRKLLNSQISISTSALAIYYMKLKCGLLVCLLTMIIFSGIIVGGKKLRRDIIVPHVNFLLQYIRRVESNENKFIFILVSLFLSVILSTDMFLSLQEPRTFYCVACSENVPGAGPNADTIN